MLMADLPSNRPYITCQRPIWTGDQCGACAPTPDYRILGNGDLLVAPAGFFPEVADPDPQETP